MFPQKGTDDLQGHGMDSFVHELPAPLALGGDDFVQLLLVESLVPGKGLPPGDKFLQGGLKPVIVKGFDQIVGHAVGVELTDVPGFTGGGDHNHVR